MQARSMKKAITVMVTAILTLAFLSVGVTQSGTASADTVDTRTYDESWCELVGGSACLYVPVTASGLGGLYAGDASVADDFAGWYWNGSDWVSGTRGWQWVPTDSDNTLLTDVVSGTPEQVTSDSFIDWVELGY